MPVSPDVSPDAAHNGQQVSQLLNLLSLATAMGAMVKIKRLEEKGVAVSPDKRDLFNSTIAKSTSRLLPGAKLIRGGRPLTSILSKIKKRQRLALKSETLKYRKANKSVIKSIVNSARSTASRPYK